MVLQFEFLMLKNNENLRQGYGRFSSFLAMPLLSPKKATAKARWAFERASV